MTLNYEYNTLAHYITKSYGEFREYVTKINKTCDELGLERIPMRLYNHNDMWCINACYLEDVNRLTKIITLIDFEIV